MDFEDHSQVKDSSVDDAFGGNRVRSRIIEVDRTPHRPEVLAEVNVWANLIMALKDGLPLPNNPLINVRRIEEEEKRTNNDYTILKQCCTSSNEVRDAKDFKPMIKSILRRINDITRVNELK